MVGQDYSAHDTAHQIYKTPIERVLICTRHLQHACLLRPSLQEAAAALPADTRQAAPPLGDKGTAPTDAGRRRSWGRLGGDSASSHAEQLAHHSAGILHGLHVGVRALRKRRELGGHVLAAEGDIGALVPHLRQRIMAGAASALADASTSSDRVSTQSRGHSEFATRVCQPAGGIAAVTPD